MIEEISKYIAKKLKMPPNYRNIEDDACLYCIHLKEKQKSILPPFKSYICVPFGNNLSEAESYCRTCDAHIKINK